MFYDQELLVLGNGINLPFFELHFTENNGMAWGMEFGGRTGKIFLTLFRLVAVSFIGLYLSSMVKKAAPKLFIISLALILAGALGNILDSVFYGQIFEESTRFSRNIAQMFPESGGYAPFLEGRVVDMLSFNLFQWPDWVPFFGGATFFEPIFNIADASISLGVFLIILFHRRFFDEPNSEMKVEEKAKEEQQSS